MPFSISLFSGEVVMHVLIIQLPVRVVDMSALIVGVDNARTRMFTPALVPLLMREDLSPVLTDACPEVLDVLAIMTALPSREHTEPQARMSFPKAGTRRRDQHRFSPERERQITTHGRPGFHREIIG
jgi:hypothetical protein